MLFGIVKMGNFGLKQRKMFLKIVISKVKNSYSVWRAISKCANNFLGTLNGSGILHLTQTIIMTNCSFIKCKKNAAKMNKIVQKWQFWMTFYTTMKMEVRLSPHGAKKWFHSYWFLIAQHINYPKIIMRAPVHFFWVVTTLGLQCQGSVHFH